MSAITIKEREYELLNLDKLTFAQQRELKRLTGGMGLKSIMLGVLDGDADAVFGYLLLCVQHANPKFTAEELDACNMMDLLAQLRSASDEEEGIDAPPTIAGDTPADSLPPPSGEPTPETTGTPALPIGSA